MRIVNFGQVMSVERGFQMTYQFTVELPGGERVDVLTDDGTIQQLVDMAAGGLGELSTSVEAESADMSDMDEYTFGGDLGEIHHEESQSLFDSETVSEPAPIPKGALGRIKRPAPPVDEDGFYRPPVARTVPKDEMGYPIVSNSSGEHNYPMDDGEDDGAQI